MEYNTASVCISSRCCTETYRLHLLLSRSPRRRGKRRRYHHHKNARGVLLIAFIARESNNYEVIQPNKHTRRLQAWTPNAAPSDCAKTGCYNNRRHYVIAKIYYFRQCRNYNIKQNVYLISVYYCHNEVLSHAYEASIVLVSMETKDKPTNNALVRINYAGSHYMTGWPMFTR